MIYFKSYYVDGKQIKTPEYVLWCSINSRCKVGSKQQKRQVTYIGCYLSTNFLNFQYFATWCNKQKHFKSLDKNGRKYHLDKDILIKGNKCYGENTCVFVPCEINTFFIKCDAARNNLPIGVTKVNKSFNFRAKCKDFTGKQVHLGVRATPEEAFVLYKTFKEAHAIFLSIEWYNKVSMRVIKILRNFQVNIID